MNIFIVYHSQTGLTHVLAKAIADGVKKNRGAHAFLRRIPDYEGESGVIEKMAKESAPSKYPIPNDTGVHAEFIEEYRALQPYSVNELKSADALVVGSPVYFGNMSAATKIFMEAIAVLWTEGYLENKACGAFVTSGTFHGGKEQTLASILASLLTYSMIPVGLPFRATYMHAHGSIFGPTATRGFTPEDKSLAELFGERVGKIAFALEYGKKFEEFK